MAIPSTISATGLTKAEPGASTCLSSSALAGLAQSVDPFDLVLGQSADARMRAAGIGDGDRHHDLTGARCVGDAHLHAVEMASDKGCVLVAERHIESDARAAPLLGRGNEGCARAQNLAHRRAKFGVQNCGGMFQLAVLADGRRLAVAFRSRSLDAERRDRARGEQGAKLLPYINQRREVFDIAARERILDHCDGGGSPRWGLDGAIHLDARLLDDNHEFANLRLHLNPSASDRRRSPRYLQPRWSACEAQLTAWSAFSSYRATLGMRPRSGLAGAPTRRVCSPSPREAASI